MATVTLEQVSKIYKEKGKAALALSALNTALAPYLAELDRQQREQAAESARRAAEVAAIRDGHSSADRHEIQEWLMPYRHLLPPRLRGRNERLDEPFGIAS